MKELMPLMFVGHGSPMVALEDSAITRKWKELGEQLTKPKAILAISAHWYGDQTDVQSADKPKQIYDMYGFPEELYKVKYRPSGSLELTEAVQSILGSDVKLDDSWGIDHGTWSVLKHMYPEADIPVVQLRILMRAHGQELLQLGERLKSLRSQGYLIIGSGNIVHNLRRVEWDLEGGTADADAFDAWVHDKILGRDHAALANYQDHPLARYAVPTPDHYNPLLYILGARDASDNVEVFNHVRQMGSISMTSYLFS